MTGAATAHKLVAMVEHASAESAAEPSAVRSAEHASPRVLDALLGMAVALALALIIATGDGGSRPPDAIAYLFAAGFGALMLLRRRMPRSVLVLSVLGVFAYYTLDYPPIGVAIPVLAALFSAAQAGLMAWATGAALMVFVVSLYFRIRDGVETIGFLLGYESVSNLALFAAAIALGDGVRTRRIRAAQQIEIARLTESQLTREAKWQLQGERERISRELHDTVGHTMSVISLQAGVAAEAVGRNDGAVGEALDRIRNASSQTLGDLRSMVRILRSDDDDLDETRSLRSLAAVQELVDVARGAGVEVITDITAAATELSPAVDAAAFRVIQESITNIIRHADATQAHVKAGIQGGQLQIIVSDNGRGSSLNEETDRFGIAGMTERVRLLGGSLTTHTDAGHGFTVDATIPARLA